MESLPSFSLGLTQNVTESGEITPHSADPSKLMIIIALARLLMKQYMKKTVLKNVASTSKSSSRKKYTRGRSKTQATSASPPCQSDCSVFVVTFAEYMSDRSPVPSSALDANYLRRRYATILWNYGLNKAGYDYLSENDDPPRPKNVFQPPDRDKLVILS